MLAHKAMRVGYYWPTVGKDSAEFVKSCNKCQRFAWIMRNPPENLSSVSSPWPFAKWGVDIMGPMPPGERKQKVPHCCGGLLH
jgi:hypothetical protein